MFTRHLVAVGNKDDFCSCNVNKNRGMLRYISIFMCDLMFLFSIETNVIPF